MTFVNLTNLNLCELFWNSSVFLSSNAHFQLDLHLIDMTIELLGLAVLLFASVARGLYVIRNICVERSHCPASYLSINPFPFLSAGIRIYFF